MGLSRNVMHMFYIVFTTAIVIIFSVTTAVACKRYAKHRVTAKQCQEYDTNVNNYDEESKKRSSFDGVEVLEMKELKATKLSKPPSEALSKQLHNVPSNILTPESSSSSSAQLINQQDQLADNVSSSLEGGELLKKSGKESPLSAIPSHELAMSLKQESTIAPKPTSVPPTPPLKPKPKVLPPVPSSRSLLDTQSHQQDDCVINGYGKLFHKPKPKVLPAMPSSRSPLDPRSHQKEDCVISGYAKLFHLRATPTQQPPHPKMNPFSYSNPICHPYDEVGNPVPAKKAPLPYCEQFSSPSDYDTGCTGSSYTDMA